MTTVVHNSVSQQKECRKHQLIDIVMKKTCLLVQYKYTIESNLLMVPLLLPNIVIISHVTIPLSGKMSAFFITNGGTGYTVRKVNKFT